MVDVAGIWSRTWLLWCPNWNLKYVSVKFSDNLNSFFFEWRFKRKPINRTYFSGLWKLLGKILKIHEPLEQSFKEYVWSIIIQKARKKLLLFYEIPGPIRNICHYDRQEFIHEDQGVYKMPDSRYFNRNPLHVIDFTTETNVPKGSCILLKERKRLPFFLITKLHIDDVEHIWGTRFVIVASQIIRERAIISENCSKNIEINPCQYAILEMVGKTRYNGETFAGPNSMSTMMKDPKPLNYLWWVFFFFLN